MIFRVNVLVVVVVDDVVFVVFNRMNTDVWIWLQIIVSGWLKSVFCWLWAVTPRPRIIISR